MGRKIREIRRTLRSIVAKPVDLQPVISYFDLLETYAQKGFLEVMPSFGEAYITAAALYALALADDKDLQQAMLDIGAAKHVEIEKRAAIWQELRRTAFLLRTYSDWLETAAGAYERHAKNVTRGSGTPFTAEASEKADNRTGVTRSNFGKSKDERMLFAVHVVADDKPHDLLYTILIEKKRRWWCPWRRRDKYSVVAY